MNKKNLFDEDEDNEDVEDVVEHESTEITPKEQADHVAGIMCRAFEATKMFKVVEVRAEIGQIHILGKVIAAREGEFLGSVVHPVLKKMKELKEACNGFIGKQFMLKEEEDPDELRYAWVLSFASPDLSDMCSDICRSFEPAIPRMEVIEAPLLGVNVPQSGGMRSGRKGASPTV